MTATNVPPTPTSAPSSVTFNPVADAYVESSNPTTNYGTATQFRVDGSPLVYSYLRFAVQGLSGTVTRATLRIYANSALTSGYQVNRVSDNAWGETAINYGNMPAMGALIGSSGAIAAGIWTSVDVTSYVTGNGTFSFGLTDPSTTALSLASRESANKPQLVVTTSSGATPIATPTNAPPTATLVPPTATSTRVPPTATSVAPTATATRALPTATAVPPTATFTPAPGGDPVVLLTGDSRSGCDAGGTAVAKLLDTLPTSWPLLFNGDATNTGAYTEFTSCYDTTYGRHKAQIKPVPGNHEYMTSGGSGYFQYYGTQAGESGKGYYSFNVGTWHIVALNTEISHSAGSAQELWLKNDLAANPAQCTLAYWHEPLFSSGEHGNNTDMTALWTDLYNANAEIVMNGHDHDYERFAPQNPSGALDTARGIREFVTGMGGVAERAWGTIKPNSEVRNNNTWGVLKLTLHANSYDWQFLPVAGSTFSDSGSGTCH